MKSKLVLALTWLFFSPFAIADPQAFSECLAKNLDSGSPAAVLARAQAEGAGLHYISPEGPGITRVTEKKMGFNKKGEEIDVKVFHYFNSKGQEITDETEIKRLNALGIPPGYEDKSVWISPDPKSHIQSVALDERGRKQYRYHSAWLATRSEGKFERAGEFGEALGAIRTQVAKDLDTQGSNKNRVLAAITRLLDRSHVRVGSERYAEENETYGLTTLLKEHVKVTGDTIAFDFTGKSDVMHQFEVTDPEVARVLKDVRRLKGTDLMQYADESGAVHKITAADINAYLKEVSKGKFSAKDFRTWAGSTMAVKYLAERGPPKNAKDLKKAISETAKFVSEQLRNEPATAKKNYIDPEVFKAYEEGKIETLKAQSLPEEGGLTQEERIYLKLR